MFHAYLPAHCKQFGSPILLSQSIIPLNFHFQTDYLCVFRMLCPNSPCNCIKPVFNWESGFSTKAPDICISCCYSQAAAVVLRLWLCSVDSCWLVPAMLISFMALLPDNRITDVVAECYGLEVLREDGARGRWQWVNMADKHHSLPPTTNCPVGSHAHQIDQVASKGDQSIKAILIWGFPSEGRTMGTLTFQFPTIINQTTQLNDIYPIVLGLKDFMVLGC